MAINFETALGMREHSMRIRAERASVLSSNLANVDTPNYKARDIDFQAALSDRMNQSSSNTLSTSHSGHMGLDMGTTTISDLMYRTPSQASIDGNSVEEHVEHAEFMKNSLEFQVSFTLLNSSFKGLQKAIRGE